jgi:hypothetical protein
VLHFAFCNELVPESVEPANHHHHHSSTSLVSSKTFVAKVAIILQEDLAKFGYKQNMDVNALKHLPIYFTTYVTYRNLAISVTFFFPENLVIFLCHSK